ncbi:hypothetical protein BSL78_13991 [Apostichopus japonicus]|uniref:Uncharacterized protein n=1 Tax=Stichopus japonicus TaxID=307972 RepID=A0A2G8KMG1_STIJA|nr:hypothetical protein BSL78_13991 [Apostichopus japonicus]
MYSHTTLSHIPLPPGEIQEEQRFIIIKYTDSKPESKGLSTSRATAGEIQDKQQVIINAQAANQSQRNLAPAEPQQETTVKKCQNASSTQQEFQPSASNGAVGGKTAHQSELENGVGSDDAKRSDNIKGPNSAMTSPTQQEFQPSASNGAVGGKTAHQSEVESGAGSDDAKQSDNGKGPDSAKTSPTQQEFQPSASNGKADKEDRDERMKNKQTIPENQATQLEDDVEEDHFPPGCTKAFKAKARRKRAKARSKTNNEFLSSAQAANQSQKDSAPAKQQQETTVQKCQKASPTKQDIQPSASNGAIGGKTAHQSEQEGGVGSDDSKQSDNGKGPNSAQTSPTQQEFQPSASNGAVGGKTAHQSEQESGVGSDDAKQSDIAKGPNSAKTSPTQQEFQPSASNGAVGGKTAHQSEQESGVGSDDAKQSDIAKGPNSAKTSPTQQEFQPSTINGKADKEDRDERMKNKQTIPENQATQLEDDVEEDHFPPGCTKAFKRKARRKRAKVCCVRDKIAYTWLDEGSSFC